ncbi:MAG TPA: hypothetical protein ENH13_03620 [Euryarchaeota archaeon]|nr:hypothetical protein BMS3Abin16_00202 [archaeon BMS3Abin16]GBE56278.1 hypothetical protein BMS3Bbin16_00478 [archaeon BMS3Bbin16]HDH28184.1 hypothetical protein [Euryarchaeota archaeon]HDH28202.1 hypothetical protein [Euryarchaeota archaeon]HDY74636.1 hypothetical protein [Euryarchaeota archaeon]
MVETKIEPTSNKENMVLTFLKQTKRGKYAIIETSSIEFSRVMEQTEIIERHEEEYYYGIN